MITSGSSPYRDHVQEILDHLDPSMDRDPWLKVGMALHAEFGPEGFELFDTWSRGGGNYKAADVRDTFRSLEDTGGGITFGTMVQMAKQAGWIPPLIMPIIPKHAPATLRTPSRTEYTNATPAQADHPYLVRKGIEGAAGLGLLRVRADGSLLVPMHGKDGELQSVQAIAADGQKLFAAGVRAKGGRLVIGNLHQDTARFYIAEGLATAWSVHQAMQEPVVVAFSAGWIPSLAQELKAAYTRSECVIAADAGKPGEKAAADAAEYGCKVATPTAGDWNDQAQTGADIRAEILHQIETPPRYRLLSGSDVLDLADLVWLIKGVLPAQGLAQIYGPSKSGKSFLAFDMGCAVAEGATWFGYQVKKGSVVYLALEGEAGIKQRVQAWTGHHGRALPADMHLVLQPFRVTDDRDIRDMAAVVPAGSLIIIDTQNRAAPTADENSSKDMGQIIEGAKLLQSLTGGIVVLVAHTGKDASKGPRGHSSQIPAVDAAIEVDRNGDQRSWRADKVKDGKDGSKHGFTLEVITVDIDADGDAVTSCIVEPCEHQTTRQKPMTESQKLAETAYLAACEAGEGELGKDGTFTGLHREAWRKHFYAKSTADNQDTKKTAFNRVRKELVKAGLATVTDDVYRLTSLGMGIQEKRFAEAARQYRDTGQNRDITGTCPGQERDGTGHHPMGCPDCPGVPAETDHLLEVQA